MYQVYHTDLCMWAENKKYNNRSWMSQVKCYESFRMVSYSKIVGTFVRGRDIGTG